MWNSPNSLRFRLIPSVDGFLGFSVFFDTSRKRSTLSGTANGRGRLSSLNIQGTHTAWVEYGNNENHVDHGITKPRYSASSERSRTAMRTVRLPLDTVPLGYSTFTRNTRSGVVTEKNPTCATISRHWPKPLFFAQLVVRDRSISSRPLRGWNTNIADETPDHRLAYTKTILTLRTPALFARARPP